MEASVGPALQHQKISVPALPLAQAFELVDGRDFACRIIELCASKKRFAENLSVKEDYCGYNCWMLPDGSRGFAVGQDFALINVFSHKACGDKARGILDFAKKNHDNLHFG